MQRSISWRRSWRAIPLFSIAVVLVATTVTHGLSSTLPNDSDPRTFLGIGHYRNFDGYAAEVGVYYNDWNANRTIDIMGSMMNVYLGSNCKNHSPTMVGQSWSAGETYATVTLTVTNGDSLTYRITRDNFCRHLADGNLNVTNSRTALGNARFIGKYQLPLGDPTGPDEETGKYKVNVRMSFTPKVVSGFNSAGVYINDLYNPSAYFRVRASHGLVSALGSTGSGSDLRKLNTRVYTNVSGYYSQAIEFGSPCSLTSGQTARFGVYDPDNYNHFGGISGTQNYNRPFTFYLEEQEAGASGYTPLASSRYTVVGGASRGTKVTRAGLISRGFSTNLPSGITAIESTTAVPDGDNANSPSTLVDFTPKVDAKYRLRLFDVYTVNFLQLVVPFDGIYNAIDCDKGTELEPGTSMSPSVAAVGSQITAESWVDNNGSVNSGEADWQRIVWLDAQGNSSYDDTTGDVIIDDTSGNMTVDPDGTEELSDFTHTINDPSKAQICVSLSLTGVGSTTVENSPSISCSPIGRYPQTQVSGGDVIANGEVSTVVNQIGSRNYGSWVEYSIFAASNVNSISAASLPAGGYNSVGDRTALTYANRPPATPGNFAADLTSFGNSLGLNNGVWQSWNVNTGIDATLDNVNDIEEGQINRRDGHVNITGSSWGNLDGSYVIYATGNVSIRSPIEYNSGPHSSLDDLPQLVIIADGYIRIDPSVDRVDAWLISNGRVLTCATAGHAGGSLPNYYSYLNTNTCDSQLRTNGPIQAGSLYLRRTGGAGADGTSPAQRSTPSEVINLRSDAYLWAYGQASQGQSIRTDSVRELPPRF